jgi:hypothetical protein
VTSPELMKSGTPALSWRPSLRFPTYVTVPDGQISAGFSKKHPDFMVPVGPVLHNCTTEKHLRLSMFLHRPRKEFAVPGTRTPRERRKVEQSGAEKPQRHSPQSASSMDQWIFYPLLCRRSYRSRNFSLAS